MPNLADKSQQSAPVPGTFYVMVVEPGTKIVRRMLVSDFLAGYTGGGGGGSTPLSTPTLTATVISSTQIDLSWTNVANESSYLLQRSLNNISWTTINSPAANVTSYSNTGLTPGTLYYYRIKAVGDGVTYSDSGYGTDSDTTSGVDVTAPVVASATVYNADPDTVVLVFTEVVTGAAAGGYSFKKNGSAWSISTITGSGNTWYYNMASAAVNGDVLLDSYDSTTGATIDAASNELVSFTDNSVDNQVAGAFSPTYLTWGTLDTDYETYNTAKGVRVAAGAGDNTFVVEYADQTIALGERLVVRIDDANMEVFCGLHENNTDTGKSTINVSIKLAGDGTIGWRSEVSASWISAPATVDSTYYCLYRAGNTDTRFQKSNDGITWTNIYTWTIDLTGFQYVGFYSEVTDLDGFLEIFKLV